MNDQHPVGDPSVIVRSRQIKSGVRDERVRVKRVFGDPAVSIGMMVQRSQVEAHHLFGNELT